MGYGETNKGLGSAAAESCYDFEGSQMREGGMKTTISQRQGLWERETDKPQNPSREETGE